MENIKVGQLLLGIELVNYIKEYTSCHVLASCGIGLDTIPIYQFLDYNTGKLNHFYRLADKTEYRVAVVQEKKILPMKRHDKTDWLPNLTEFQFKEYFHTATR